ncbi:MAG TPA: hypothetical protein VGI10_20370 [Polyangiaceae bacterium]|jgi:hypothetical protein
MIRTAPFGFPALVVALASVCACSGKDTHDGAAPGASGSAGSGGQGAAAGAPNYIVTQLNVGMGGGAPSNCLPRPLQPLSDSTLGIEVPCSIVEASYNDPGSGVSCGPCAAEQGRAAVEATLRNAVVREMQAHAECDQPGAQACADYCFCTILQETGAAADTCRQDPVAAATTPFVPPGFCYISDADVGAMCSADPDCLTGTCSAGTCAASAALANCASNQQQLLGFVSGLGPSGQAVPTPSTGSLTFIGCSQ